MSQGDLALATGLSRPLISAVETRRHVPSVHAALVIARCLGATVSELFETERPEEAQIPALGRLPTSPGPVSAVRMGDCLVYHRIEGDDSTESSWARGDGWYADGTVELFEDAEVSGALVAGCDPAMGLAATLLPPKGPHRLVAIPSCSRRGLDALKAGRIHMAVVHQAADGPRPKHRTDGRFLIARWRVGLASPEDVPPDFERIARGELSVAHRGQVTEAQKALNRALESHGGSALLAGPMAMGHLDAVRHVAHGWADLAITIEAAALQYGLKFWPLEEHQVELHIGVGWGEHPGVTGLLGLIASNTFRARLAAVGGYDLSGTGRTL